MTSLNRLRTHWLPLAAVVLTGCQGWGPGPRPLPAESVEPWGTSLTLIVAELQMHLHDDTYRRPRTPADGGRNVFESALRMLDRLRDQRARAGSEPENADLVIEFARGRALERLRRFEAAATAFKRAGQSGSVLEEPAQRAEEIMRLFLEHGPGTSASPATPGDELEALVQRSRKWQTLARRFRATPYEFLALEEAEAAELLRVDWLQRNRPLEDAIAACRGLIERHHASKLYERHLIRLGDIYAAAARRVHLLASTRAHAFDGDRYERLLEQAFAAYELAGETRRPELRREAVTRIEALLAYHEGTFAHAW